MEEKSNMDRRFKEVKLPRDRVDKTKSLRKKKRSRKGIFHGYKPETSHVCETTTTESADDVASTSTQNNISDTKRKYHEPLEVKQEKRRMSLPYFVILVHLVVTK